MISPKKLSNISPDELGKMNRDQLLILLDDARSTLDKRLAVFSRQGKNFYSPAQDKINDYYNENSRIAIDKISRNRALNEIFHIQAFFSSETSSVKGARRIMAEQDIRIFGVNPKTGRSPHRLSREQRDAYWKVYNEFISQRKNAIARFGSDKIMQYLGDILVSQSGGKIDYRDNSIMEKIWDSLNNINDNEDYISSKNILIGSNANTGSAIKNGINKPNSGKWHNRKIRVPKKGK